MHPCIMYVCDNTCHTSPSIILCTTAAVEKETYDGYNNTCGDAVKAGLWTVDCTMDWDVDWSMDVMFIHEIITIDTMYIIIGMQNCGVTIDKLNLRSQNRRTYMYQASLIPHSNL